MNPLFIDAVVAERHRDMRTAAAAAGRARIVRRAGRVALGTTARRSNPLRARRAAARHAG